MASPNPSVTELIVTTLRRRQRSTVSQIMQSNALYSRLVARGKVRPVSGGRTIFVPLEYAENSTFKYYSGYELLDITPSEILTGAEFDWKQAAVVISSSGLETDVQNNGPEQLIDILSTRIDNGTRTMKNQLSIGAYSDGTGAGGKQVTGLQALVADDPTTGTVGGIDRSANVWWRNMVESIALGDWDSAHVVAGMKSLWLKCVVGKETPDLIVADVSAYTLFWDSLTAYQRITKEDSAKMGWQSLAFVSADVIYDGDSGIADNHMYFLNTEFMQWRPSSRRNIVPLEGREPVNQDSSVVPVVWAGNMVVTNSARQGVLFKASS